MTPEEEVRRAGKADEILRNELFKEAVRDVEAALLMGIRQSAFKDAELREKLCQQYMLLHSVLDQLRTHMETGRLAEQTIADRIRGAFR